jgi:hypothetical protein
MKFIDSKIRGKRDMGAERRAGSSAESRTEG